MRSPCKPCIGAAQNQSVDEVPDQTGKHCRGGGTVPVRPHSHHQGHERERAEDPPDTAVAESRAGPGDERMEDQPAAAERQPLVAAAASPEELVRRFLAALSENDIENVRLLAVTEDEFKTLIYPELPAADPGRNTSAEFVWSMLHTRSESSLHSIMSSVGGRHLWFEEIRFTGETSQYRSYKVHRESLLVLRDEAGDPQTVRLFGSVLELNGQFKIFSFNR